MTVWNRPSFQKYSRFSGCGNFRGVTGRAVAEPCYDARTQPGTHDMGGKSYKVVHQNRDEIIVEAEFDNYPDAAIHLANSIYMEPFIVFDDGEMNFSAISPEEARKFAVERIEFSRPGKG